MLPAGEDLFEEASKIKEIDLGAKQAHFNAAPAWLRRTLLTREEAR